jgi:ubiquinone biosynthesis protein UbiJ
MFRLTIEKSLNYFINANNIDLAHINNKIISLRVDEIDLSLFFLCLNSRIFVIDSLQNKKVDVSILMNKSSFLSIFKGATIEELLEAEDIEINGSVNTAQQLANLLSSSSIDIEELISQYTGDIVAHQIGQVFRQFKDAAISNDSSIINTIKDEITTVIVAPSRSKFFKGRA